MDIKEIYAEYGELMIQHEIMMARINNLKKAIAEELNKPPVPAGS